MKLLTQKIIKRMPKLYSTQNLLPEEKRIIVKFFCPWNNWTWYVLEGEKQGPDDWMFFGYVKGHFSELGYFLLSELREVRGPWGLKIERDAYFDERKTLQDIITGE